MSNSLSHSFGVRYEHSVLLTKLRFSNLICNMCDIEKNKKELCIFYNPVILTGGSDHLQPLPSCEQFSFSFFRRSIRTPCPPHKLRFSNLICNMCDIEKLSAFDTNTLSSPQNSVFQISYVICTIPKKIKKNSVFLSYVSSLSVAPYCQSHISLICMKDLSEAFGFSFFRLSIHMSEILFYKKNAHRNFRKLWF